jgi:hypothetical protein
MKDVFFFDHVIEKLDYITGNKFIEACEEIDVSFAKMDYVFDGFDEVSKRPGSQVFVTHQSDFALSESLYSKKPNNLSKWFAENCDIPPGNDRVVGIPNGLNNLQLVVNRTSKNGMYSSAFGHICDFHQDLYIQNEKGKQWKNLCYMNFTPATCWAERTHVINLMRGKSWITERTGTTHLEFAEAVYHHPFTLSPRGNGYDCVRTWESLYLRSIPIIKRCNAMEHFEDLPILLVDEWEQVDESFLLGKLEEYKSRKFDMSKATMSYWREALRRAKEDV